MNAMVRFSVCLVAAVSAVLFAVSPGIARAEGLFAGMKLGAIPRGLPGPDEIDFPKRFEPGTIVVVTAHKRLYYVTSRGRALRYVVGVGRDGMRWKGTAEIARKAQWPTWTPPAEMHARARAEVAY